MALPEFRAPQGGWKAILEPVLWLLFAAAAFAISLTFDGPLPTYALGAAFWPRVICAIIVVAASILLVSRFLSRDGAANRTKETRESRTDVAAAYATHRYRTVLLFVLPPVWVFFMHKIGFLLATPVFILAFTWVVGVHRWKHLLIFAVSFYVTIIAIFYKLIFTPLPMGAGWFNALNGKFLGLIQ